MAQAELLVVTGTFQLPGLGLALLPVIPTPNVRWRGRTTTATVVRPDGGVREAKLTLSVSHSYVSGESRSQEQRWCIVPILPDLGKDDVPVGSRIRLEADLVEAMKPDHTLR